MMKKVCIFLCLNWSLIASGQDIHFSQFMSAPAHVSPAMAGLFDGDYRLAANYRNQWSHLDASFKTLSFSADMILSPGLFGQDFIGGGISVFADRAGEINLATNQLMLAMSYHKSLGSDHASFLSLGLQGGLGNKRFDITRLQFDDQYDGIGFDPDLPITEQFETDNILYPDFGLGVSYYIAPTSRSNFYIGGAIHHINEPDQHFLVDGFDPLYRKYVGYTGGQIPISDRFSFLPNVIYMSQGRQNELVYGAYLRLDLNHIADKYETGIAFGAFHRFKDAFIPMLRLEFREWLIGLSYDVNASKLTEASNGAGGPEISIQYIIQSENHKRASRLRGRPINCPKF